MQGQQEKHPTCLRQPGLGSIPVPALPPSHSQGIQPSTRPSAHQRGAGREGGSRNERMCLTEAKGACSPPLFFTRKYL